MDSFWCEHAWLPGGLATRVRIDVEDGTIVDVTSQAPPPPTATRLPGVVLPGFANAHSHAFHRALRGRTNSGGGTFWTWRERMYEVAHRLDPETYLALARAAYAEMALAGVTTVGEFHYLRHQPDGTPYSDPNAMAAALRQAARDAGLRLTLLDACYLTGGIGEALAGPQRRFGDGTDGTAHGWARRFAALRSAFDDGDDRDPFPSRIGAAIHSVRAVPPDAMGVVVAAADGLPLHVHLSEQPAENEACRTAYGRSPTQLLADHGALGPHTTVVHATHLDPEDIALLGGSSVHACLCPTTERDLADGIGPADALRAAGAALCLGSDQHTIVDPLAEARAMEMHERLASGRRGWFTAGELVDTLTWRGQAALGWPEAGRIATGAPGDLVAVRLDTVRTAGVPADQIVAAGTASDVDTVISGGRTVVTSGRHLLLDDVARLLSDAISSVTGLS